MNSSYDLVAINGPWQAISFLNFYLAEYGENPKVKCAVILYETDSKLGDVCISILSDYQFIDSITYFSKSKIQSKRYSNIWIGKLHSSDTKIILDQLPKLPIIIYEEGLHSYIKESIFSLSNILAKENTLSKKIKILFRYLTKKETLEKENVHLLNRRHINRCKRKYFLLPIAEDQSKICKVTSNYIEIILNNVVSKLNPIKLPNAGKPRVIITGQCFSNYNLLSPEFEYQVYQATIKYYLSKEYQVFWKGHPRSLLFDLKIKDNFKDSINIINNNLLPIELYTYKEKDIEICGVSSSALLYKTFLFKGNARQIAGLISGKLNKDVEWYNDFEKMLSFTESKIPELTIQIQ